MNKIYKILGKRGRITIPCEIRMKLGFRYNDVLSFEEQDENTVIIHREKVCVHCGTKPETKKKPKDLEALLDFLDDLSDDNKKVAFFHLCNEWDKIKRNIVKE